MVRAIILAAGASSRMGRPKAALPLGTTGETFLSRLLRTCADAGLPDIVVVAGAHEAAVRAAIPPAIRVARCVTNPRWEQGQLTSLLAGLALEPAAGLEAVALALVDAPFATVDTWTRLLHVWRETRAPIVRPARGAAHGHPVIFDRALFNDLRAADPRVGAKAIVRARAGEIVNVPVDDDGAFVDVDTADEYVQSVDRFR